MGRSVDLRLGIAGPEGTDRGDALGAMSDRMIQVAGAEAPEGVDRQRRRVDQDVKTLPAERRSAGVALCGLDRREQGVIEAEAGGQGELVGVVTGGTDQAPGALWTTIERTQCSGGQV